MQVIKKVKFVILIALITFFIKIPGAVIGDEIVRIIGLNYPPFTSITQIPDFTLIDFISAVVIAPPLETLIGQYLPIKILSRFSKNSKLIIIVSALIFGLLHYPVIGFIPGAFLIGLVFAWGYLNKRSFWLIASAHSLHNLLAFLLGFLVS